MNIDIILLGGPVPREISLSGRTGQTLHHLMRAKDIGITAMDIPVIRLAAHVHELRKMSFAIDTEMERHNGDYPGFHARYTLRSVVVRSRSREDISQ